MGEIEEFETLLYDIFKDLLEDMPIMGSQLGLHEYDFKMPEMSEKAFDRRKKMISSYLQKFSKINAQDLPEDLRIDYLMAKNFLENFMISLSEWPTWKMYPMGVEVGIYSIFSLIIKPHLPKWHIREALKARIKALPSMVEESIKCVDEPYSLWVKFSRMMLTSFPAIMEGCRPFWDEELGEICDEAYQRLEVLMERIEDLEEKAKQGYKPVGEETFEKILKLNFVQESPDELEREGKKEAEKYIKEMERISREAGFSSLKEALEKMKEKRPKDKEEAFKKFKEFVSFARDFCYSKGIVKRIPMERVQVLETPEPMRIALPFAGYIPPEPFSWSLTGTFLVTLPEKEEGLSHFNYYDILNTVVHEAYPGHHVQLVYAKTCGNPARRILGMSNGSFAEGWAHYCEELCLELGISKDPLYRLKVYHDALWRAIRVYLDVELSTGKISFEEAVEELSKKAMIPKDSAYSEVLRYTMNPGYQISYNYVKRKIFELRRKVKEKMGSKFSLLKFHEWLLEEAGVPIQLIEEKILKKAEKEARSRDLFIFPQSFWQG